MQRTAWGLALALAGLVGCAQRTEPIGAPPPNPIMSTRPPRPVPATPRPAPPPQPTPPPVADLGPVPRAWYPPGGMSRGLWKCIVVHHSDSPKSTPQGIDSWHRQRGWDGLGYHFVIGNGVNYPDGQVYVGPRWVKQKTGAHCKSTAGKYFGTWRARNFFNEHGVGICLIGDFEKGPGPTRKQIESLSKLIAFLCDGNNISTDLIYGHGEVTHKTLCPGRTCDMNSVRRSARVALGQFQRGTRSAAVVGR